MSQKGIREIIQNTTSGHKGDLIKYVDWLVPIQALAKSYNLLNKNDDQSLLALIKFNFEFKTMLLNDLFLIEGFLTTRFDILFKNKKGVQYKQYMKSKMAVVRFEQVFAEKFGPHWEEENISDLFNQMTFGLKVEVVRLLDSNLFQKWFYNKQEYSKSYFLKSMKTCVVIRNILAHNTFVVTKENISRVNTVFPTTGENSSQYYAYISVINQLLLIFGKGGLKGRIKRISDKYKAKIKFDLLMKK